jgi:hypothetical protein
MPMLRCNIREGMRLVVGGAIVVLCQACGSEGPTGASHLESTVHIQVKDAVEMPFHGPAGPGSEPMSITFSWIATVSVTGGGGVTVESIETRVREARLAQPLVVSSSPSALVMAGQALEVRQSVGGPFESALYPGSWEGAVVVRLRHPSTRREDITVTFAFR